VACMEGRFGSRFYQVLSGTSLVGTASTDEPGKQVSSAIKIKNVSRSHVAFKVSRSFFIFH
jgi:hypothetical protein